MLPVIPCLLLIVVVSAARAMIAQIEAAFDHDAALLRIAVYRPIWFEPKAGDAAGWMAPH